MDRHNPVLLVTANGRSLTDPSEPVVMSLEHRELGDGGKEAKIVIANVGLEFLDGPDVQEGRTLEWAFGYPGNVSPVFSATIFVTEPSFDAYGGLALTIYAYDAVANAVWQTRQKTWRDPHGEARITHSEVVELLAAENGWNARVEPTGDYVEEIHQAGISDWDFLHNVLAPDAVARDPEKQGAYRVWFDDANNTLHFAPVDLTQQPVRVYTFATENDDPVLLFFRPRVDTKKPDAQAGAGTTAADVDGSGNVVSGASTAQSGTGNFRMDGTTREYAYVPDAAGPAAQKDGDSTASGQATAAQAAEQIEYLEADITVVGDPFIRANDIVSVWNVGQKFSGRYLVHEVSHNVGPGGFITEITGKKDALPTDATGDADKTGTTDSRQDGVARRTDIKMDSVHRTMTTVDGEEE